MYRGTQYCAVVSITVYYCITVGSRASKNSLHAYLDCNARAESLNNVRATLGKTAFKKTL